MSSENISLMKICQDWYNSDELVSAADTAVAYSTIVRTQLPAYSQNCNLEGTMCSRRVIPPRILER